MEVLKLILLHLSIFLLFILGIIAPDLYIETILTFLDIIGKISTYLHTEIISMFLEICDKIEFIVSIIICQNTKNPQLKLIFKYLKKLDSLD